MIESRSSVTVYFEHYDAAKQLLEQAQGQPVNNSVYTACVAEAQVHATLAQAVAATRVADRIADGGTP